MEDSQPNASAHSAVSTLAEHVEIDLPCRHCGYNLRTRGRSARCPECGKPVADSYFADQLMYADLQWLSELKMGVSMLIWSIVVGVGSTLLAPLSESGVPLAIGLIGAVVLHTMGVILVTTRDPLRAVADDSLALRVVIRSCLFAGIATVLLLIGLDTMLSDLAAMFIASVVIVLVSSCFVGHLVYLRRHARRLPHDRLAQSTIILVWASTVNSIAVLGLMWLVGIDDYPSRGMVVVSEFAAVGVFVSMIVFGVWYIVLLIRYYRAFSRAASMGRSLGGKDLA